MFLSAYSVVYGLNRIVEGKFSMETMTMLSSRRCFFGTAVTMHSWALDTL